MTQASATSSAAPLPPAAPAGRGAIWSRPWASNLAVLLLIAACWPLGAALEDNLNPYFFRVVVIIGLNIILASSLNLINGITGQFSLGHAGFMAVGAYTVGILAKHYAGSEFVPGWAVLPLVLLGEALAAVAGLLVGVPALRLRGDYLAIATLGFGEIIAILITQQNEIGTFDVGGASGLHSIPAFAEGTNFFWVYAGVVVCVVTVWRMAYSAKGKAFLAVREDEIAAAATGVDTTYYKVLAFVVGAFFAGTAGGLSALWFGNLDPRSFGFMRSVEFVVMVVLGGSGSITGVILAAAVLTWLPEQLRFLQGAWRMLFYSLLLIVFMLVRPEGMLGRRELWWTRRRTPAAGKGMPVLVPPAEPPAG